MTCFKLLLLLSFVQLICGDSSNVRTEKDEDFYKYFSTKTVYDIVRRNIIRPESNCKPVQFWMLARHGTRYPSKSEIESFSKLSNIRDEIIMNHKHGVGKLKPSIIKKLSDWHLDADVKKKSAKKLTSQGKRDMYRLARRLRNIFPELLQVDSTKIKPGDFIFRATNTERTQSSLTAFAEGIFGTTEEIVPPEKIPTNDTLLSAFENCPAWDKRYWQDHYDAESNKFAVGSEVKTLLKQVNRRLGFNQTLNYDVARTLYNICRFETAWHPQNLSAWCFLFANDELKILEYQEDLDHYYYCGPGRQWNVQLGCQPLTDMFTHFKEIVDDSLKSHAKGIFYFAHTVTLETFMAALGTDGGSTKPLLAKNYSTSQDREYRTSLLGAFATNVVAVLYNCTGSTSTYAVSFYTAEKLEQIKGCPNGLCNWDFMERKFGQDLESISEDLCNNPKRTAIIIAILCIIGVVVLVFIIGVFIFVIGHESTSSTISHFGIYTSYDIVRGNIERSKETNCKPVQIWMLARHGTTFPKKSEIQGILQIVKFRDQIINNHKEGDGELTSSVLNKLKNWHADPGIRFNLAKHLSHQGEEDMRSLAVRLRKSFPELLNVTSRFVKYGDFVFRATNTPQTNSSLRSFSQSLFNTGKTIISPVKPPEKDVLLKAYKNCPQWEESYYLDHLDAESTKFVKSRNVEKALKSFNERLGFDRTSFHDVLDYDKMRSMYNLCRYETAFHPADRSVWCDLFSNEELKVLEYQDDLDNYYYAGPGRIWNAKLGCQPLKDMFTRFRNIVYNITPMNSTKGVFYFTSVVTLETMMAALGIDGGSSKALTAQNIDDNRKFRTSLLTPFATNIIAVLYKCNEQNSPYSVSFYIAEKLQKINGCRNGLCDWSFIEQKFGQNVRTCSMDFC